MMINGDGDCMFGLIGELYEYRSMVYNLVKRDLRGRYKGSALGFLWNIILPLIQIIVYVMVFTIIFRQDIEHYYAYLIVGMVPWLMFSESIGAGSGSVIENSQLITKIYFPRAVIPVSIVLSKMVSFLISLAIVFAVLGLQHGFDAIAVLVTPLSVLCLLLFSTGAALLLAALNVYMRDVQYMVTTLLMVWIWLTPIMYVRGFIDNVYFDALLAINPMTYIVQMFQDPLYWHSIPDIGVMAVAVVESIAMLVIGFLLYNRMALDFAEVL